jgi:hypothetical protein
MLLAEGYGLRNPIVIGEIVVIEEANEFSLGGFDGPLAGKCEAWLGFWDNSQGKAIAVASSHFRCGVGTAIIDNQEFPGNRLGSLLAAVTEAIENSR